MTERANLAERTRAYVSKLLGWDEARLARRDYDEALTLIKAEAFLVPVLRPEVALGMSSVGDRQLENARSRLARAELWAIVRTLGIVVAAGMPLAGWVVGQLR